MAIGNLALERLWRSVKYEEVYLRAYDSVPTATPRSAVAAIRQNLIALQP